MKRNQNQMLDGSNGKDSNGQWLSRLKSWVSTSEPSMQALRQHKKLVCEKAANDPQASAKLQYVHVEAHYLRRTFLKSYPGATSDASTYILRY